jgi:hypothetical protein
LSDKTKLLGNSLSTISPADGAILIIDNNTRRENILMYIMLQKALAKIGTAVPKMIAIILMPASIGKYDL